VVNAEAEILGVFPRTPRGESWQKVIKEATRALTQARTDCGKDAELEHRRGKYKTGTDGWSIGGGQREPMQLVEKTVRAKKAVRALLDNQAVKDIAGFGNNCLKTYAPDLYAYYETTKAKIGEQLPHLKPSFTNSVFAGVTFNLGPKTVTYGHRDHQNIPFGWCCVTALGDFDDTKGGHVILWDLKLVIRVPAGASYLIPSAILKHSNVDIGAEETRMSVTQYSAGGLFRWVACGMRSQAVYEREGNRLPSGQDRWNEGVALLRKWSGNHAKPVPDHIDNAET
ncbi:hypothetical protein L227DRAFT_510691, partial [Lentinus tigrinus ALCF2SS1-6]